MLYVIYQTQETVFHQNIQTPGRELKVMTRSRAFLTTFEVLGLVGETLSQVFEISSQSKQNLGVK